MSKAYHSATMPITWLCTLTEEEEEDLGIDSSTDPEGRSVFKFSTLNRF